MSENCAICLKSSSLYCSNCKKVVYCGKEHQKEHRKTHKPDCFPASITNHPVLGHHLIATRDIGAGEKIFKEEFLISGPRSNLAHFHKICLGCCDQIDESCNKVCTLCKWPVCDDKCAQNQKHAQFECNILSAYKVPPAKCQEEYLCITFLRCLLLQNVDPVRWNELLKFESHVELRKSRPVCVEQSQFAIHFIRDKCKQNQFDAKIIDFVYGIIIINGYGDPATFAVKLYPKSAKLSHACIPNTRTIRASNGLEILATVPIKGGQPLTQLYGRIFKGTHRRQELLQNIYYFSCSCPRCTDPTELGTFFSAIKCSMKKCVGYLLPKTPLDISPTSKWKCNVCNNSATFLRCVVPALSEINKEAGTDENEELYSEYEMYQWDNQVQVPITRDNNNEELVTASKLDHVSKMLNILKKLETEVVHKNHYALLPLKTALIATTHSLLILAMKYQSSSEKKTKGKAIKIFTPEITKGLLDHFLRMVKEMLELVEILLGPGMTSERGLLLFYLAEGLRFSIHNGNPSSCFMLQEQLTALQQESLKIMLLDHEDDDHRKLVVKHLIQST